MALFDKINLDLAEYMKSREKFKLSVLRMLKSAIIYESTNNAKHDLTDADILAIIRKQIKVRESSKDEYLKYDRKDLADNLSQEIEVLSTYLPEELSEEIINKEIDNAFLEIKPESIKDMGKVMKYLTEKIGGQVDMSKISAIVKSKL